MSGRFDGEAFYKEMLRGARSGLSMKDLAEAAYSAGVEAAAVLLEDRSKEYPASVFPTESTTRDGIAGTTLRFVLPGLAAEIRALLTGGER